MPPDGPLVLQSSYKLWGQTLHSLLSKSMFEVLNHIYDADLWLQIKIRAAGDVCCTLTCWHACGTKGGRGKKKAVRLRSNGAICLPRRLSGDVEWLFAFTLRDLEQSSPSGPAVGSFNGACSRTARYIKLPTRYTKHRRVLACSRSSASQLLGLKFTGKDFRLWNNQGWIKWHFKKKTLFFFLQDEKKNKLEEQNSSAYMRSEAAQ